MPVAQTFRRLAGLEGITDYVVLVTDGQQFKPRSVVAVTGYNEGLVFHYRGPGDKLDVVFVPHNFRMLRHKKKYYVGKRLGNNSACKVIDGQKIIRATPIIGESCDSDCPGEDLSGMVRTHGLALAFKALYERNIPWRLIFIIGIIIVAVIVVGYFVSKRFM